MRRLVLHPSSNLPSNTPIQEIRLPLNIRRTLRAAGLVTVGDVRQADTKTLLELTLTRGETVGYDTDLMAFKFTMRKLLGVALTAEPADTPFTIHPIIDIGFAVKAVNFPGLGARVLGYDSPVIVRLSDGSEGHFCFCHETLCN